QGRGAGSARGQDFAQGVARVLAFLRVGDGRIYLLGGMRTIGSSPILRERLHYSFKRAMRMVAVSPSRTISISPLAHKDSGVIFRPPIVPSCFQIAFCAPVFGS